MAALNHLATFHSLSSHKLPFSFLLPLPNSTNIGHHHKHPCSVIPASSVKKPPRASRKKVKSDVDLRNDLREFLSTVGLPESHVPTMKELSNNGRQDLANVVRRRGYKFIRQLLETRFTADIIESNIDTGQTRSLEVLVGSEGQNEEQKLLPVGVLSNDSIQEEALPACIETDEELKQTDQKFVGAESSTLSLQEKVAKFIQLGELDIIEDNGLRNQSEKNGVEDARNYETEDSQVPELALTTQLQNELPLPGSGGIEMFNGSVSSSIQKVGDAGLENNISRDNYISTNEQESSSHGKNVDDKVYMEGQKVENQDELQRLKFLLHQKELELTQLKQQIEKEKLALSVLQTKAETEINKAQKLISEKETELYAAEETLSGLKEVEILYSGDGESVELAGSFNGWHHKIPMDPHISPSGSESDPTESRTSRLWRTLLWLYPGVYEIKFVIDGHWRVDPQRESVTRHNVHNNILRVDN